ncbi:hypothetical protein F6455_02820 [Proteobacteria bacterium 005FR1]|nr:hypothetical protein [Proteobacteria bacterium 005FR1]
MLRVYLTIIAIFVLSGCTSWKYKIDDSVTFEIRSWNHDPIIKEVEGADAETFTKLGEGFGKDKYKVFYKGNEIPGADPATFKQLRWAYSKDISRVYLFTCILDDANPDEFELLGGSWSKDGKHVYHGHQKVDADAASFRFVGNSWAIDKSSAYHALSLVSLGCKANGHLEVKVFQDIDQETFEVIDAFQAKDRRSCMDTHSNCPLQLSRLAPRLSVDIFPKNRMKVGWGGRGR